MIKFRIHKNGFTLIEVIIAAFAFSIIALTVSGLYTNILNLQRRANAEQKIQENALYIMELMSREIRVSQVINQDSPSCTISSLTMTHPVNGTVTYSLSGGVLQRTAGGVTTDLSTSDIRFSKLNFCVMGSGVSDLQPSRVTIIASIQNATGKDIITTSFETTVTSRDVQSEF